MNYLLILGDCCRCGALTQRFCGCSNVAPPDLQQSNGTARADSERPELLNLGIAKTVSRTFHFAKEPVRHVL